MNSVQKNPRRDFLSKIASGAAVSVPALLASFDAQATFSSDFIEDVDHWFSKIKGKHRMVYDASEPHDGFPIAWAWVFYKTNNMTGTPDSELTAMVVLRHKAVGLALNDAMWEKYKFGEAFKINDSMAKAPAIRNIYNVATEPFWTSKGIEGIKELSARGVMFCVCDMALTNQSGNFAKSMNLKPEDVKSEWMNNLLPGVQPVPSGVWAIGRAQEKGCGYCYAGG